MGGKRTRERYLAKNAVKRQQSRAMIQRRRRIQVGVAVGLASMLVIAIGGVLLLRPASKTPARSPGPSAAKPGTQTGTVTPTGQPPTTVACGAALPADSGKPKPQFSGPPASSIDPASTYVAIIKTSCGEIQVKLDPLSTPIATNNFVFLADKHFYDGIWFHRIVKGFMIQGGDPLGTGGGGPGYQFQTETNANLKFADQAGILAYANSGPDTNGSQFFITVKKQGFLDTNGPYTAFGTVTKGMDVLQTISNLPATTAPVGCAGTTEACRTKDAVYIDSIRIKVTKAKPTATPSP